jgi:D-3-phosphoglycerate dehydrogenase
MFRIKTMNKISPLGLKIFPGDRYEVGSDISEPDAILVRSADINPMEIPGTVLAIARAGAGYNNIPVSVCSSRGIAVFNTPGGNANAVKELALAALFLSARDIAGGID